jgi:sugar phosphate isomerase/epimerase
MSTITWMSFPAGEEAGAPYPAASAAALLPAACRAGFSAVSLDSLTLGRGLIEDGGEQIARQARACGLEVADVGVLRIGQSDGLEQARLLARVAAACGAALCPAVVDAPLDESVAAAVAACCDILSASGVRMALEFMVHGPLETLGAARRLCDRIGWPRCGLLLDSWHLMNAGVGWAEVAALTADQIALVQVADGPALAADAAEFNRLNRWERRPVGQGVLDFAPFMAALRSTGYRGFVSPEILSYGERVGDPARCAAELKASLVSLGIE